VPTRAKYKVYIIDEVHMLTKEAFNALLKTLEEPPAHVVFIMATTEAHKIPATIISRTQRFSFHAHTEDNLEKQLIAIAGKEKLELDPAAAHTLAVASQGGFRDAISMLDQARGGGDKITNDRVLSILGWSELGKLEEMIDALLKNDARQVLAVLDQIISSGAQPEQLQHQLILALRDRLHSAVQKKSPAVAQIAIAMQRLIEMQAAGHAQIALEATLISVVSPYMAPTAHVTAPVAVHTAPPTKATPAAANPVRESDPADMARWPKVLIEIKSKNNSLYALLQSCEIRLTDDTLMIYCRFNFHRDRLMEAKNAGVIEKALETVYNKHIRVDCELKTMTTEAPTANTTNELVTTALDILGGELIDG
jgi:DNA polymerase-3 subunit gamma/tau